MKRNFPRKLTKPNRLNYNTKGLKKKHIFKRSIHRQSQICKSKFTTCTEKKITKKESIETNSITNETNKNLTPTEAESKSELILKSNQIKNFRFLTFFSQCFLSNSREPNREKLK